MKKEVKVLILSIIILFISFLLSYNYSNITGKVSDDDFVVIVPDEELGFEICQDKYGQVIDCSTVGYNEDNPCIPGRLRCRDKYLEEFLCSYGGWYNKEDCGALGCNTETLSCNPYVPTTNNPTDTPTTTNQVEQIHEVEQNSRSHPNSNYQNIIFSNRGNPYLILPLLAIGLYGEENNDVNLCENYFSKYKMDLDFNKKLIYFGNLVWRVYGETWIGWGISEFNSKGFLDENGRRYAKIIIVSKDFSLGAAHANVIEKAAETIGGKWWDKGCVNINDYKNIWGSPKKDIFVNKIKEHFINAMKQSDKKDTVIFHISEEKIIIKKGNNDGSDVVISNICGDKLIQTSAEEIETDGKNILYIEYKDEITGKILIKQEIDVNDGGGRSLKEMFNSAINEIKTLVDKIKGCLNK